MTLVCFVRLFEKTVGRPSDDVLEPHGLRGARGWVQTTFSVAAEGRPVLKTDQGRHDRLFSLLGTPASLGLWSTAVRENSSVYEVYCPVLCGTEGCVF